MMKQKLKIKFEWETACKEWDPVKEKFVPMKPWKDNIYLGVYIENVSEKEADEISEIFEKQMVEALKDYYPTSGFLRCDNWIDTFFYDTLSFKRDFGAVKEQKELVMKKARCVAKKVLYDWEERI